MKLTCYNFTQYSVCNWSRRINTLMSHGVCVCVCVWSVHSHVYLLQLTHMAILTLHSQQQHLKSTYNQPVQHTCTLTCRHHICYCFIHCTLQCYYPLLAQWTHWNKNSIRKTPKCQQILRESQYNIQREFDKKPQLSLRNPCDVMMPAVACTVCRIFAFKL